MSNECFIVGERRLCLKRKTICPGRLCLSLGLAQTAQTRWQNDRSFDVIVEVATVRHTYTRAPARGHANKETTDPVGIAVKKGGCLWPTFACQICDNTIRWPILLSTWHTFALPSVSFSPLAWRPTIFPGGVGFSLYETQENVTGHFFYH